MKLEDLPIIDGELGIYDWSEMLDAQATEIITQADKGIVTADRIVAVPHVFAESLEGYADKNVVGIVQLVDGWAAVTAWCDTTGWDCRSDAVWKWAPTYEDIVRSGLDNAGRANLGVALETP